MSVLAVPAQADLVLRGGSIWLGPGQAARAGPGRPRGPRDRDRPRSRRARPHRRAHARRRPARPPGGAGLQRRARALPGGRARPALRRPARVEGRGRHGASAWRRTRRTLPPGTWIRQGNWDHRRWPDGRLPSRARGGRGRRRTIPCSSTGSTATWRSRNSLALRLAGIDRETPDPPGGLIERDARGEPTGILMDNALDLVRRVIPEPARELNRRAAAGGARRGGAPRRHHHPGRLRDRRAADLPRAAGAAAS